MSLFCCNNQNSCSCTGFAVVASIIIGIITAFLTFSAVITLTPAFLWVLFGIAIVYLAITLILSSNRRNGIASDCACTNLTALLIGILGTILISVILLGVTFAATSVIGAIFAGLLLAFFSLTVTTTACLVKCTANCTSGCDNNTDCFL